MKPRFPSIPLVLLALLALGSPGQAAWRTIFDAGVDDEDYADFCQHDGVANPPPGSALRHDDDDTYLAGQYPAPVGTVASDEMGVSLRGLPALAVTFALGGGESSRRVHFMVPAAEAGATSKIRLILDTVQLRWVLNGVVQLNGQHDLVVRLNGTVIAQFDGVTEQGVLSKTLDPPDGLLVNGPNVLEYARTGGSNEGIVFLDRLKLEINGTARRDADGDGLPEFWEEENGLSDQNAADAAQDADGDGLTALQEMARGSHPLRRDTDGDGLLDGAEPGLPGGTSPVLRDTDGDSISDRDEVSLAAALSPDADRDGVPDSWEIRQGSLPLNAGDAAPLLKNIIGLKVNHAARPGRAMEPFRIGGVVPQLFWNNTRNLIGFDGLYGTTADVASPHAGFLVDGTGADTGVVAAWTGYYTGATGNSGDGAGRLTDAMIRSSPSLPATMTLSGIPWASYDVYVYTGGLDPRLDAAVRLNGNAAGDRWLKINAQHPVDRFQEGTPGSRAAERRGNYVRFRNFTGAVCTVSVITGTDPTAGLSAVQIVNTVSDGDADGMPDWYEAQYRLNARRNDANEDPDGDGLKNIQEFARGTNPFAADTDGDGLSDLVETGSRVYLSPAQPGTDPLLVDTDGDGLSDGDEIFGGAFFSHPLLADTDFDGQNDLAERRANSNPSVSGVSLRRVPVRNQDTGAWSWVIEGIQIVQDHATGNPTLSNLQVDRLCSFTVRNPAEGIEHNGWRFALDNRWDGLHWRVEAGPGAFAFSVAPLFGFTADHPGGEATGFTRQMGFSGLGRQDISDRLRVKMDLEPPAAGQTAWSLRVRLYNMEQNPATLLSDDVFQGVQPSVTLQNGGAYWQSDSTPPRYGEMEIYTRPGVSVYFSNTRLDETAAFASARDTDKDGLPDIWEVQHGGDPFNPLDGTLDEDGDGLNQWEEFTAGTLSDNADTDGDGVPDGAEVAGFSDPLSPDSKPFLWAGLPASAMSGDFDQNGLPDAWEAAFQARGLLPSADSDGDGISNAAEAAAGTDPLLAASVFRASLRREPGGTLRLEWPGPATKRYTVFESPQLNDWQATALPVAGPDSRSLFSALPPLTGNNKFYRVRVTDKDQDGDGVNDWTEALLGTDPMAASSAGSPLAGDVNGAGIAGPGVSGDMAYLSGLAGDFKTGPQGAGTGPVSPMMASRFLTQASFGPTMSEIERVRRMGYSAWITDQITAQPAYYHSSYLREIREDLAGRRLIQGYAVTQEDFGPELSPENLHTPFLRAALQQGDQLRQRMAYALSQIFVVSRRDTGLFYQAEGLANFYDILVRNALGNFRDILLEVTRHPVMGRYLSHIGNQKARPELSQFPDENYAREIMQLFSIGLWELNPDGTRRKDAAGADMPTYGNTEITELARVFTGFWYGGQDWGNGGGRSGDFTQPMDIHPVRHDFERKQLLRGASIPARSYSRESALMDVEDAIDNIFQHPNTPPFICRQLIQFLVTSNPTRAYLKRVQDVFVNDGTGQRGNLAAVTRAILLDPEARSSSILLTSTESGVLREPLLRFTALCRAFGLGKNEPDLVWWDAAGFINTVQQKPLYAPSVFNFYRPDYKPPGPLSQRGLSAPAFQIADSSTTISYPNVAWEWVKNGVRQIGSYQFPLDISAESALASTPERLLDRLNLLLCQGLMSPATRTSILAAVNRIPAGRAETRARIAIWLTLCGPDGAVQK